MEYKKVTSSIEVERSAEHVFNCINQVSKWWVRDIVGNSTQLNDEFHFRNDHHYSKQKLIEVIPNKKIIWLVTECDLNYLKDRNEWTNTKMIFEIIDKGDKTEIHFTHEGLDPTKESYADSQTGWDMFIKQKLFDFITKGKER